MVAGTDHLVCCRYPAPVILQPRQVGCTRIREAIILFLTIRLQRPCRMRNYLVPVIAPHR